MPVQTFNPLAGVVTGVLQAHALAQSIRRAALQEEAVERQKSRIAREDELQDAELQLRMNAAGVRPATAGDEFEAASGQALDVTPDPKRGYTLSQRPSDIKGRMFKLRGQQFVMPSQFDRERGDERQFSREMGRRKRVVGMEQEIKSAAEADRLRQTGFEITPEIAERTGLQAGTRVPMTSVDDVMRAMLAGDKAKQPVERKVRASRVTTDDAGNQTEIVSYDDGSTVEKPLKARGKKTREPQPRDTSRTEAQIRKLDLELVKLHAEAQRLGDISRMKDGEKITIKTKGGSEERKMNALLRSQFAEKTRPVKRKADLTQRQRDELAQSIGWRTSGEQQARAPQNPYR